LLAQALPNRFVGPIDRLVMRDLCTWLMAGLLLVAGCGDDGVVDPGDGGGGDGDAGDAGTESILPALLEDPTLPLPEHPHEEGLLPEAAALEDIHPLARLYVPRHELWSNGSIKIRHLALPPGTQVDTSDRARWSYPRGTMIFKTFAYPDPNGSDDPIPVETRIMRKGDDGWGFDVYQWQGGAEPVLLPLDAPVPVPVVGPGGEEIIHEIPNRFDCRTCHEATHHEVLGLSELQLHHDPDGVGESLLETLHAEGWLSGIPPQDPAEINHPDALTREVLGYAMGNCVHCHNDSARARSSLDLGPEVFLEETIHRPTEGSGTAAGVRVVPGDPEGSILYQSMTWTDEQLGIRPMPPVGVQRLDDTGIALVHDWIASLDPEEWPAPE
jgi:mono/diheme cytochrome c family protein